MAEQKRHGEFKGETPEEHRRHEGNGEMTVSEAGHIGGQKVKQLVEEGKEAEHENR